MARKPRLLYPDAWYHVMNRGAAKQAIFHFDSHRLRFLELLEETVDRFGVGIHAYCLMGNHYHLLVHTPEPNLPAVMRYLNAVYAQYFNATLDRDGPLFRGRYHAVPVEVESYWHGLSRYIHRNPLVAKLVMNLDEYRWSSYRAYLGIDAVPSWLRTDTVFGALEIEGRPDLYRAFVETEVGEEPVLERHFNSFPHVILGSEAFQRSVWGQG